MLREVIGLLEASGREGECYKFAYNYVKDHPDWELVHGSVNGAPHHAWCEYHDDLVYDPVLDQTFVKDDYLRVRPNEACGILRSGYGDAEDGAGAPLRTLGVARLDWPW